MVGPVQICAIFLPCFHSTQRRQRLSFDVCFGATECFGERLLHWAKLCIAEDYISSQAVWSLDLCKVN